MMIKKAYRWADYDAGVTDAPEDHMKGFGYRKKTKEFGLNRVI